MSLKDLESKLQALSIEKNSNTLDISKEIGTINLSVNANNPFALDLGILGGSRPRAEL